MTSSDIELFGRALPQVSSRRHRCLVCQMQYRRDVDAEHRLCPNCVANPDGARESVGFSLGVVDKRIAALHERWVKYQESLDDTLFERWSSLVMTRDAAAGRLQMAQTGSYRSAVSAAVVAGAIAAAQQRVKEIEAKLDRTRKAGGALVDILEKEAAFKSRLRTLLQERGRWEIVLQEIAAAEGELVY